MARRSPEVDDMSERHTAATAKVRVWGNRADKARKGGRRADADRCDDKVRDWASRARQIERMQSIEKQDLRQRAESRTATASRLAKLRAALSSRERATQAQSSRSLSE